jgi:hypothetical protein
MTVYYLLKTSFKYKEYNSTFIELLSKPILFHMIATQFSLSDTYQKIMSAELYFVSILGIYNSD